MQYMDLQTRNDAPKSFTNPLTHEVIYEYFTEPDNTREKIVVKPFTQTTLPTWLADIVIEHVIDAMINEQNLGLVTPEMREELRNEVLNG